MIGKLASLVLLAASFVRAEEIIIMVGGKDIVGHNVFSPRTVTAAVGDVIAFSFQAGSDGTTGNHSIVQTSADALCTPLQGGFSSTTSTSVDATFAIKILNASQPIYFACGSVNADNTDDHCMEGEIGVINPPAYSTDNGDSSANTTYVTNGMDSIPADGTAIGTGIDAEVLGYWTAQEQYSLPPFTSSSTAAATASGDTITPLVTSTSAVHLSAGAIAGIAVGAAALLMLIAGVVWRTLFVRKRKQETAHFARHVKAVIYDGSAREVVDVQREMRQREGPQGAPAVQPRLQV